MSYYQNNTTYLQLAILHILFTNNCQSTTTLTKKLNLRKSVVLKQLKYLEQVGLLIVKHNLLNSIWCLSSGGARIVQSLNLNFTRLKRKVFSLFGKELHLDELGRIYYLVKAQDFDQETEYKSVHTMGLTPVFVQKDSDNKEQIRVYVTYPQQKLSLAST